ncbi:AraC family transcriptional regulator [Cetobacterium somerae]|uniref:helix-turn-helix domain-containing protein n=1 Tax=Cetobacterium somerae TaxID=188913 RepID=UPI002258E3E3|nr:AraC family transcriptional regulator [Cetobacterium somerae]MCX3068616.1 AraC family transcriptional regulator [Cetobacterium somerae]
MSFLIKNTLRYEWDIVTNRFDFKCESKGGNKLLAFELFNDPHFSEVNLTVSVFKNGVYFYGIEGEIEKNRIKNLMGDHILIINSESTVSVLTQNGTFRLSGILCYKGADSVIVNRDAKVFILRTCVFDCFCNTIINDGEVKNKYEHLVKQIFDSIGKNKKNLTNESFAIANIIAMSVNDNEDMCLIKRAMDEMYTDPLFNLDALSQLVYMSRRKVQYALSEQGTSFSDEIKRRRVAKIKSLINSSNRRMPMTYYANMAGFRNLSAATKGFMDVSGMSMKEFIFNSKR